jgi:hypothetical protein
MQRKISALLGAVTLAVPIAATPPALAHDTGSSQVRNRDWSATCLEIDHARSWDGADATVDWCSFNGSNQRWRLVDLGGGWHNVVVQHTGQCLDVRGVSHDDGAQIQQWTCLGTGQENQHWKLVGAGSGYSKLVARHSGKCLDKAGWNVVQWNCHDVNWQEWGIS